MLYLVVILFFFFSSRRRHTRCSRDWSSDVCSSDLSLAKKLKSGTQIRNGHSLAVYKREPTHRAQHAECNDERRQSNPRNENATASPGDYARSEEHTSELQSRLHLVCRLLLEKKKQ